MNRKLHNSLMAVISSAALLIAGLLAATPVEPVTGAAAGSQLAIVADSPAAAPAAETASASSRDTLRPARMSRHSVQMPFFSFAPRS